MAEKILPVPPFPMNEIQLRTMLEASDVEVLTSTKLTSVEEDGVVVEGSEGKKKIPCDTVLMALGYASTTEEAEAYKDICPVHTIGDSVKARNIMSAVEEAYEVVNNI